MENIQIMNYIKAGHNKSTKLTILTITIISNLNEFHEFFIMEVVLTESVDGILLVSPFPNTS